MTEPEIFKPETYKKEPLKSAKEIAKEVVAKTKRESNVLNFYDIMELNIEIAINEDRVNNKDRAPNGEKHGKQKMADEGGIPGDK